MRRRSIIAAAASAVAMAGLWRPARADDAVDVLLVVATDLSRSEDEDEALVEEVGHAIVNCLTHPADRRRSLVPRHPVRSPPRRPASTRCRPFDAAA